MPKLTIEQPHSLPLDEVKKRLQALADKLAAKYDIKAAWTSEREATLKRTGVDGKLRVEDGKVSVLLDLNFMLSPMKSKIEERIKRELQTTLV